MGLMHGLVSDDNFAELICAFTNHGHLSSTILHLNLATQRIPGFASHPLQEICQMYVRSLIKYKIHKLQSRADRSSRSTTILDKLFICQLELNLLCLRFNRNKMKRTRSRRWAPCCSAIWLYEIPKCDCEQSCYSIVGYKGNLCVFS